MAEFVYIGPMTPEVRERLIAAADEVGVGMYGVHQEPDRDAFRVPEVVAEAFDRASAPKEAPKQSRSKKAAPEPVSQPEPEEQ